MNNRPSLFKKKSGQAMLLLVLIALVASLGLALSVANRSNLQQRGSTYNVQGEQAYSAAESGLDAMLEYFASAASVPCTGQSDLSASVGAGTYTSSYVCVEGTSGQPLSTDPLTLSKDVPEIFYLNDLVGNVAIDWQRQGDTNPSLEVNLFNTTPSSIEFEQHSYYWGGYSGASTLDAPDNWDSAAQKSSVSFSSIGNMDYIQLTARTDDAHNVVITFTPSSGEDVPLQGYTITSVGRAGKSERRIVAFYRPTNIGNVMNNIFYTVQSPTSP